MTTQNDQTAEGSAGTTANGAAPTSQQPAVDWASSANPYKESEARFKGLQPKFQELTVEHDKLGLKLSDLETKHTKLTGDFEARQLELNAMTAKYAQATTDQTTLQAKYDRLQTVMAKFPDLMPFLGNGSDQPDLLPTGTGEALEKSLAAFRDVVKKQGAATAKDMVQGSTGSGSGAGNSGGTNPGDAKPKGKSELLQLALQAQREGKTTDYEHYYNEWLRAS